MAPSEHHPSWKKASWSPTPSTGGPNSSACSRRSRGAAGTASSSTSATRSGTRSARTGRWSCSARTPTTGRSPRPACSTSTPSDAGCRSIEVLVFTGERNVAAPWLNDQKKVSVRESEFRLECSVLGAEAVCWDLDAYRTPGYQPSPADIDKIVEWFTRRRPGAVILPPATDAHLAHRMTRALAAIGLVGAHLADTLVLTGWTPWGPLPQPNAYFSYDAEAERTKEWAIHCHASQVLLTDYTQYCSHLGRAYAALTREWSEGHSLSGRDHRADERFVGVELFQIESYDPARTESNHDGPDPDRPVPAERPAHPDTRPRPRHRLTPGRRRKLVLRRRLKGLTSRPISCTRARNPPWSARKGTRSRSTSASAGSTRSPRRSGWSWPATSASAAGRGRSSSTSPLRSPARPASRRSRRRGAGARGP